MPPVVASPSVVDVPALSALAPVIDDTETDDCTADILYREAALSADVVTLRLVVSAVLAQLSV